MASKTAKRLSDLTHNRFHIWKGGDVLVYKRLNTPKRGRVLATLLLTHGTKFYVGEAPADCHGSAKCRATHLTMIKITSLDETKNVPSNVKVVSGWHGELHYPRRMGAIVRPKDGAFSTQHQECAEGIHFFFSKERARAW